jgi:hypothetical protein
MVDRDHEEGMRSIQRAIEVDFSNGETIYQMSDYARRELSTKIFIQLKEDLGLEDPDPKRWIARAYELGGVFDCD